jgi:hypothetical protein
MPQPVWAASGDPVSVVTVPVTSNVGVSIAFDGNHLYYTNFGSNNLFEITTNGALVKTMDMGVNLGALSWDAGRKRLWAGTLDSSGYIYLVDPISGTKQLMFDVGSGFHDGLAYDASDDTLWFSNDASTQVQHYTASGLLLETFFVGFTNSGIAVGGDALYMGSAGEGNIYRVDKATKQVLEIFATPGGRDEDLECDNFTFAPKEVMWSKDAYNNQITAFEVTPGTCQFGLVPSPQGQMQVILPKAVANTLPISPTVVVVNANPISATYEVRTYLFQQNGVQVAQTTNSVYFGWSGKRQIFPTLGVFDIGSYTVTVDLWLDKPTGDEFVTSQSVFVSIGQDYLRLNDSADDLKQTALVELNQTEDIAVQALSQASASFTGEAADFLIGLAIDKVFGKVAPDLPTEFKKYVPEGIQKVFDWIFIFNDLVQSKTQAFAEPRWRGHEDKVFNVHRKSVDQSSVDFSNFIRTRPIYWNPAWSSEIARREEAIQNKNETTGGWGISLQMQSPYVSQVSLTDMKGQFDWLRENLIPFIESASQIVLLLLLITLIIAVVIVALPASIPVSVAVIVVAVAKGVAAAFTILKLTFGILKASKLVIGMIILSLFAMMIGGAAENTASPIIIQEHSAALNYLRSGIPNVLVDQRVEALQTAVSANHVHVSTHLRQPNTTGGLITTQLFRADGTLLDFVDYVPQPTHNNLSQEWRLPPGRYWAVSAARQAAGIQAERTQFEILNPEVAMDISLSRSSLTLGELQQVTITLTNLSSITNTGTLILSVVPNTDGNPQIWTPTLNANERASFVYTYVPQSNGAHRLRISVSSLFASIASVERAFVVGSGSALALNITGGTSYSYTQTVSWTLNLLNPGTQPTTTSLIMTTYDRNNQLTSVSSTALSITLAAGEHKLIPVNPLTMSLPGAYRTDVWVGEELRDSKEFMIESEGRLFVHVSAQNYVLTSTQPLSIEVRVENESFQPIDAAIVATVTQPNGNLLPLSLVRTAVGAFSASFAPTKLGTYALDVQAKKTNFAGSQNSSWFALQAVSTLVPSFQGELTMGQQSALTVTVTNEQLIPIKRASVLISSTQGLVFGQTNDSGKVTLFIQPSTSAALDVRIEKTGYADAVLRMPVQVLSDTTPPSLEVLVPVLTNNPHLVISGTAEAGAQTTVNGQGVNLAPTGRFTAALALAEGSNTLTFVSIDETGNQKLFTRTTVLDTIPPSLIVTYPEDGQFTSSNIITVTGQTDADAIVSIADTVATLNSSGGFTSYLNVEKSGTNLVTIAATDLAGNTKVLTRRVQRPVSLHLPLVFKN